MRWTGGAEWRCGRRAGGGREPRRTRRAPLRLLEITTASMMRAEPPSACVCAATLTCAQTSPDSVRRALRSGCALSGRRSRAARLRWSWRWLRHDRRAPRLRPPCPGAHARADCPLTSTQARPVYIPCTLRIGGLSSDSSCGEQGRGKSAADAGRTAVLRSPGLVGTATAGGCARAAHMPRRGAGLRGGRRQPVDRSLRCAALRKLHVM